MSVSVEIASRRDILNRCDFILCDIKNIDDCVQSKSFDTVIMNLPFARDIKADIQFLKTAIRLANNAVYLIQKTSTRKYIMNMANKLGIYAKVIAEVRFNLPSSNKFHKQDYVDIHVDLIRFILTPKPIFHNN